MAIILKRRYSPAELRQQANRARQEELRRQYGSLENLVRSPIHGSPVEKPVVHGEALANSIRKLAAKGTTDDSIARQLGIANLDRMRTMREFLGCPSKGYENDDPDPEAP